jgi:hypothetical protein
MNTSFGPGVHTLHSYEHLIERMTGKTRALPARPGACTAVARPGACTAVGGCSASVVRFPSTEHRPPRCALVLWTRRMKAPESRTDHMLRAGASRSRLARSSHAGASCASQRVRLCGGWRSPFTAHSATTPTPRSASVLTREWHFFCHTRGPREPRAAGA